MFACSAHVGQKLKILFKNCYLCQFVSTIRFLLNQDFDFEVQLSEVGCNHQNYLDIGHFGTFCL